MLIVAASAQTNASAQRIEYLTHDAVTNPLATVRVDVWTDVKTSGDGRVYSVGNCTVLDSLPQSQPAFSGTPVLPPPGFPVANTGAVGRTVAVVQCVDPNGIAWQRYLNGFRDNLTQLTSQSNARAISVWPVFNPNGTLNEDSSRVAVCGETYDQIWPLAQAQRPFSTLSFPSGFISVYEGDGDLLWSFLLFPDSPSDSCVITDISIRVVGNEDIVTYCGVTDVVSPQTGPLATLLPFQVTWPLPCAGDNPASGGDHGGQWDGLVGRLSRVGTAQPAVVFQSMLGGNLEDGLFGIAEITASRFVVVGTSGTPQGSNPATNFTFPLPSRCYSTLPPGVHGTVAIFDAGTLATTGLRLAACDLIPSAFSSTQRTCARDVLVHGGLIHVVGSTTDQNLTTNLAFQPSPAGAADGFIAVTDEFNFPTSFPILTYIGAAGDDGLTGIASWNEFSDHFAVTGFAADTFGATDMVAYSLFKDTEASPVYGPLLVLRELRESVAGNQIPAAPGPADSLVGWSTVAVLGPAGGGGIGVDDRGRVHVVGMTDSPGLVPDSGGRPYTAASDGVRMRLQMLPAGASTSEQAGDPTSWYTGGTTPACALQPGGLRVVGPSPLLYRMMIDIEGTIAAGSTNVAILLDRPPQQANTGVLGALQFGFPASTPLVQNLVEIWTLNNPTTQFFAPLLGSSVRFRLSPLPASATFTTQFLAAYAMPIAACGTTLPIAGSPALTVSY